MNANVLFQVSAVCCGAYFAPEGFAKACPNPLHIWIWFVIPSAASNADLNEFISGNRLA